MNLSLLIEAKLEVDPLSPSGLSRNGKQAGCKHRGLYWRVKIKGKNYMCHNVIMTLHIGSTIPKGLEVDHIDRDGLNNSITNLRLVTRQENLCNTGCRRDSLTGVKGVSHRAGRVSPYVAHKQRMGKRASKSFSSLNEAVAWLG